MNICNNCPAKSICEINSFIKNKSDIAVINIESCQIKDSLSGLSVCEEIKTVKKNKALDDCKKAEPVKKNKVSHTPRIDMSEIMVEEEDEQSSSDDILSLISDKKIEAPDSDFAVPKNKFMEAHPEMVQCDICKTIIPGDKAKKFNGKIFCINCWEKQ